MISEGSRAAIEVVRARALRERDVHRQRIRRALADHGVSAELDWLCAAVVNRGRVTLNFHPDRLVADGRSVAEALRDEGLYRSQFETGISNGGLTAYPGGDRDQWERRLFHGAYHPAVNASEPVSARPKYGALNVAEFTNGPAPAFGSCALVLSHHQTDRTTFLFGDSSERYDDLGTADAFEPVLAALLERLAATGQMLGLPGLSVRGMVERLRDPAPTPAFSRALDDYIETHTHGPINLASDADALVLDPCYRDTPTGVALHEAAHRYQLELDWHSGSRLTLESFPSTTPTGNGSDIHRWQQFLLSGRAAGLAARIISSYADDGTHLTAAAIGGAARSFVREPENWTEWGAPDPSLTVLKDLWRVLAAHGTSPAEA
jgi:Protein of unknown function (DUF3626)